MKFKAGWAFPDADRHMVGEMGADGSYQLGHLQAALRHVALRRTAIDGGAHVGTWSRPLSVVFGRVLAMEPSRDTYECLVYNMRERGCRNVECHRVALGAQEGSGAIVLDRENEVRGNTGARRVVPGEDMPVVTIDSYGLPDVDFVKLDVEGSEPMALSGAAETIRRCRPIVLFENKWIWTKHFQMPKHAVRDLLIGHGYRMLEAVGCDQIWGPV